MNAIAKVLLAAVLAAVLAAGAASPALAAGTKTPEKTKIHRELDALGAKIDAFEARARRESAQTRARVDARVKSLRSDKTDADRALDKLEAAGASAGKDLKAAFQSAFKKLKDGYRDASREAPWSKKNKSPKSP